MTYQIHMMTEFIQKHKIWPLISGLDSKFCDHEFPSARKCEEIFVKYTHTTLKGASYLVGTSLLGGVWSIFNLQMVHCMQWCQTCMYPARQWSQKRPQLGRRLSLITTWWPQAADWVWSRLDDRRPQTESDHDLRAVGRRLSLIITSVSTGRRLSTEISQGKFKHDFKFGISWILAIRRWKLSQLNWSLKCSSTKSGNVLLFSVWTLSAKKGVYNNLL